MDMEAELELAKRLITAQSGKPLDHLPLNILRGALEGKSLSKIAESYPCSENYAKEVSAKLCKYLSIALGKPVTKRNLRPLLAEHLQIEKQNSEVVLVPVPPIVPTPAAPNSNFVGREGAFAELHTKIRQGAKVIVIQAPGGAGKTTLAQEFLSSQEFEVLLDLPMAKETASIKSVESVVEEWLKQDFQEEPGRDFGVMLSRLKRQLKTKRVGVLIDNLEPALDAQGRFIKPHCSSYVELLRVLTDASVQSLTLITSREPLAEGLNLIIYQLPRLTEETWADFFRSRDIEVVPAIHQEIHRAYGGNALAMNILCEPIHTYGGMGAYWREHKVEAGLVVETAVENLIVEQFNRLEVIHPEAYRLLCRLGCYRYQDVPTVPIEGLFCLLWDVPEARLRQIIKSLQGWSLVEYDKGKFWLHPIIREQAIGRLRASEDWEITNHKAAEFWTESVTTVETVKDVWTAFEAYHHYIAVGDFEQAASVIVKQRDSKWENNERLGRAFYRLGLLKPIIISIEKIINKISISYCLGSLYNILGDLYWLTGSINKAISCHTESGKVAKECLNLISQNIELDDIYLTLKYLEGASIFNLGLCQIDLGELQKALILFEQTLLFFEDIRLIKKYDFLIKKYDFKLVSSFCLAFLKSALNSKEESYNHAVASENLESLKAWSEGYKLFFLGLTYKNLEEKEKAFEMYNKAISFAEESHYPQVKAKALTGLAELYRLQSEFETALSHHAESIEILEKIGAKCDLAEAYYQLALTYQAMGEPDQSQEYFTKAIQLYEEMEAPKQVEKVRRAIPLNPP